MIRPPGLDGVAFTEAGDGDLRSDLAARRRVSADLGLSAEWALVRQVHGHEVEEAKRPGLGGPADAIWTRVPGLPLAVLTADCYGVAVCAEDAVGVAHAGWRGADRGVVGALVGVMTRAGSVPVRAAIGPGIGPCCFEVGPDVADRFGEHVSVTTWGHSSVDLIGAIEQQLGLSDVWISGSCTHHDEGWFSYRREATAKRCAVVAWLP